jgi:diacylglycerol kinase family enzyme
MVLVNAGVGAHASGGVEAARQAVARALLAARMAAEVRVVAGHDMTEQARAASAAGAAAVVAAGGDGTVNAVAHALVGRETALGVLPLGTFNHFARDAGIPLDLAEAARVVARGEVRAIDAGSVNGRSFINNSSLGLYPDAVLERERQRRELGRHKHVAMAIAACRELRAYRPLRVRLDAAGRRISQRVPFLFVGNNRYDFLRAGLGRRERLDGGRLWLYLAVPHGRLGLLRLIGAAALGHLRERGDFHGLAVTEATVRLHRLLIPVGVDGEVVQLRPPLRYRIRPGALRVLTP